ncbi:MAG: tetrapyrrole methylase family protein/MazG family protein [Acidimicrobiales bacterium]
MTGSESPTAAARPIVSVCGLGPGSTDDLTSGTLELLRSGRPTFIRTARHPTSGLAHGAESFDSVYDSSERLDDTYRTIADHLTAAARQHGSVVYAVPGSPLVLERSVAYLRSDAAVDVELHPAISFLDATWARLGVDPVEHGVRLVDGHTFARDAAGERGPLLVAHAHASWVLSDIKLAVDAGSEMTAIVLQSLGTPDEKIFEVAWPELDRVVEADHLTSLYLPEVTAPVAQELQRSVELMHRLRQDCPWDQEQTHESLRPHLIEEAYEVLEAIEGLDGDDGFEHLEEELGDLWFQILFHAELATEAGQFTIADVARNVHDKLVARHPHVFGEAQAADAEAVLGNWEANKLIEKGRQSVMDGIPPALPALSLAEKVLKKGARAGHPADAEYVADLLGSMADNVTDDRLGTALFALVEQARIAGIDAESALRQAAQAAADRFRLIEHDPTAQGRWVVG